MGLADLISARAGESAEQEKTGLASIFGRSSSGSSSNKNSGKDKNAQVPKTGRGSRTSAIISGGSKPSSSSSKPGNKEDHVIKDAEMEKKNAQKLQAALQAVRKFQRDGKREAREGAADVAGLKDNGDVAAILLGGNAVVDVKSKKAKKMKRQQQKVDGPGAATAEEGGTTTGPTSESEEERNKRTLFVGHVLQKEI